MVQSCTVMMVRKIASVSLLAAWTLTTVMQTSSYVHRGGPQSAGDRVRLEDVKVLTLYESRQTTGRRSAPLPQLACQGGCGSWTPSTVQCYNMGSDGSDAAWKCEASMPEGYSFSSIEVGCEGYDYPEDPYILKDSCQLVYSLSVPSRDRRSFAKGAHESWDGREPGSRGGEGGSGGFGSRLVQWAVLGIVGYVLYNVFVQATSAGRPSPLPEVPVVLAVLAVVAEVEVEAVDTGAGTTGEVAIVTTHPTRRVHRPRHLHPPQQETAGCRCWVPAE